jgi:hypothetical protein
MLYLLTDVGIPILDELAVRKGSGMCNTNEMRKMVHLTWQRENHGDSGVQIALFGKRKGVEALVPVEGIGVFSPL